jgi:hypothetical protein
VRFRTIIHEDGTAECWQSPWRRTWRHSDE